MKSYATQIADCMEIPYRDVIVGVAYLPYIIGQNGVRMYERIEAAEAVKNYFERLMEENLDKLKHSDSECFRSRVAKYKSRRNKALACEIAWRHEDGEKG